MNIPRYACLSLSLALLLGTAQVSQAVDDDMDGYSVVDGDCNDADPDIHPGATEACADSSDNDCDGAADCTDPDCAFTFNCDVRPPDTFLTLLDPVPTGAVANFVFTSDEPAMFECSLDSSSYVPCTSPFATVPLSDGEHMLFVRARDFANLVDGSPAAATWEVNAVPSDTALALVGSSADGTSFEFVFSSDDPVSFECSLDSAPFAPCPSPFNTPSLADGDHVLSARAVDSAGLVDPTPASFSWRVDPPSLDEAARCQAAIAQASARFTQTRNKALAKCHEGRITGAVPFSTDCEADPKAAAAIDKAKDRMGAAIAEACGGGDETCGGNLGGESLPAIVGWPSLCPDFQAVGCNNPIVDCAGIVACLQCMDTAAVDRVIDLSFGALPQAAPDADGDLLRCRRTYARATSGYFTAKSRILQKCWKARFQGKHENACPDPGDGRAEGDLAAADTKRKEAVCKACGGADGICDGADDLSPEEIFGQAPPCPGVVVPDGEDCGAMGLVEDLTTMRDCSGCVLDHVAGCNDLGSVPQAAAYPAVCASPPVPTLVGLDVTPATLTRVFGQTVQYTATGLFSDGSQQDLTTAVSWSSSDEAVASISNAPGSEGLAIASQAGASTITATLGGTSGSTSLTVHPPLPGTTILAMYSNLLDSVTFVFEADQPGATFLCRMDSGPVSPCASPQAYAGLSPNVLHTFTVHATDGFAQSGPAVSRSWFAPPQDVSADSPFTFLAFERLLTLDGISLSSPTPHPDHPDPQETERIVYVQPGAAVDLHVEGEYHLAVFPGYCPGCHTQFYIGIDGHPVDLVGNLCLGSTSSATPVNADTTFAAPEEPGVYMLNAVASWEFQCANNIAISPDPGENTVAVLVVLP